MVKLVKLVKLVKEVKVVKLVECPRIMFKVQELTSGQSFKL